MELVQPFSLGINQEKFKWVRPNDFKAVFNTTLVNIRENFPQELGQIDILEGSKDSLKIFEGINRSIQNRNVISKKVNNVYVNLSEVMELNDCFHLSKYLEIFKTVLNDKLESYKVKVELMKRNLNGSEDFYFKFKLP